MGWGLATPFLNRCKIAHTLLGRSFALCFETVLGMNKITPTPSPPLKEISKKFFYFIFLKNLFEGVGLATLSFTRCNMVQGLLRRSWFKYLNIMKKLPLPIPFPSPFKNSKFFYDKFRKKLQYLILRSGKFNNLVTSFFFNLKNDRGPQLEDI